MSRSTKSAILDAAEALFAEHGFNSTSLRNITVRAGVNLASVNYHFGSKDALIRAVYERRIIPMNERRLRHLAVLQRKCRQGIPLQELIEAFIAPALELARDTEKGGAVFLRLLGRAYTEPNSALQEAIRNMHGPLIARFKQAFSRALPELPREELYWRMHFMVGLLAYMMAGADMMRLISSSRLVDPVDTDATLRRLKAFLSAGMRAPVADEYVSELVEETDY